MTPSDYPDESTSGPGGLAVATATTPAWGPNFGQADDFATQDTTAPERDIPDAPDFARVIPVSAIQDAKNQQQADDWAAQQRADLADQWGAIARQQLQEQVADWNNEPQPQPEPTPTPEAAPAEPGGQGVTMNDLADLFHQVLNKVGGAASAAGTDVQNAMSAVTGFQPNEPVGPESAGQAPAGTVAAESTPSNPLLHPDLQSLGGIHQFSTELGQQAGQALTGGQTVPVVSGVLSAALNPELAPGSAPGELAGEAISAGVQAAKPLVRAAVAKAAPELPGVIGDVVTKRVLAAQGVPAIAGASEDDGLQVARDALTADHPIVQAAAKVTGEAMGTDVNPEAVAKLIQSPSFNPANLAKAGSRRSPIQTAALAAYRQASDAGITQQLIEATGKAEPTVDEQWNAIPGIGGRIGEAPLAAVETQPPTATGLSLENLAKGAVPPSTAPTGGFNFGDAWRSVNRGIVQAKLMNPLIHTWNLLSETLSQYADPRQLAGIVGDFKTGEAAMRDPTVAQQLVDESGGRLNLPTLRSWANDLDGVVKGGLNQVPVVGGVKNAYDAVTAFNHKMLFESLGQRLQLASYEGAKRMGMDPEAAAAYANAKFGQISNADRNELMQWIGNNAAFAGKWLQGTGVQLGSLVGKPGFGGYASTLTDAQKARLAAGLRGDFLKGVGLLVGSHALINHHLSGQWPWQNEDGRWLDINTGQQTPDGKTIYVPDPFFRRVQDALHLLAVPVPGNPIMKAEGTTITSALLNKAAPLIGAGADVASGAQWISPSDQPPGVTGGPPIVAPGTTDKGDLAKQMAAFAFNQVSPVQVKYIPTTRSPEGVKLKHPEVDFGVGPSTSKAGVAAGVAGAITGSNVAAGPHDIGTKEEYFADQDAKLLGADVAKQFHDAGVQLNPGPNTLSKGTGKNKVDVPTTADDRATFAETYKDTITHELTVKQSQLTKANPQQIKNILTQVERAAFEAARAKTEHEMDGSTGVQSRVSTAWGSWGAATGGSTQPARSVPPVPSSRQPAAAGGGWGNWGT